MEQNLEKMTKLNIRDNEDGCDICNSYEKLPAYMRQRLIIDEIGNKIFKVSAVGLWVKIGDKIIGIKEYSKLINEKKPYQNTKIINDTEYIENISFIGGKIEPGQSILEALKRELIEELQNKEFADFLFRFINKNTKKIYLERCKMLVFEINLDMKYIKSIKNFMRNTGNSENCLFCGKFFEFRNIEFMTDEYIKRRGDIRSKDYINNKGIKIPKIIPFFYFGEEKSIPLEERIKIQLNNFVIIK